MKSIVVEADVPNICFDVNSVSKRALTKSVHQTISISGQSGSNGRPGADGSPGCSGDDASCGNGGEGKNGDIGSVGESGQHGTDSQHALIQLYGTVENLCMQLKTFQTLNDSSKHFADVDWHLAKPLRDVNYKFQLAKSKAIILVQAVGGNGGDGGPGGDGGKGGRGGFGASGQAGVDLYSPGTSGCSGGPGGNGGYGGFGGFGGNAGAGGHVQIRSVDPRLFMLIDLDCRAGIKGKGGRGGKGGCGGCGAGGACGGPICGGGMDGGGGFCGQYGRSGADGRDGEPGRVGFDGRDGKAATDGSIHYAVVDMDGNIMEIGSDKYHVSVSSYTITDENSDGIYEPSSEFYITNIKWINNGAMTLPSGSILSFPSTEYFYTDINDISVLTGANVNEVLLCSHRFKCHLNDVPNISFNQPYIQPVTIKSEINLLNRLFSGSQVSTTLTCQYPIQITKIKSPTFLDPNERSILTIHFTNISARSYGACPDSVGSIEFMFSSNSLMKILPINKYQITPNGHSIYKINEEISPKSTKSIDFEIILDGDDVSTVFYDDLFWNVDLLLRNKLIERHRNKIRVIPTFRPDIHTDVLLITNSLVNRAEFVTYQKLFQLFKYSSQTWNIERYGTLHNSEIKWLNTTDLIIFIHSNHQSAFDIIKSELFLQHMNSSENAGFICIGTSHESIFDYNNLQFEHKNKSEATNQSQVGNRFIWINSDDPLLVNSHLPFNVNEVVSKIDIDEIKNIQSEIDLNSKFGRLLCAMLFYQGFEKSHVMFSEKWELANCIFRAHSNKINFNKILVGLAMSIIEYEYDHKSQEFQSSKRLVHEVANVIQKENVHNNDWFYLLIQSLYEYIDSKFFSSFPWCGCTRKARQRHKLLEILNDIQSLSSNEIPRNKKFIQWYEF